jgi:hypothetical protein
MNGSGKYDLQKLLFRRQFILGPRFAEKLFWWNRLRIRDTVCLTIHPDLMASQKFANGKSITLLGYILDPENPEATDKVILDSLIEELARLVDVQPFIERTYRFGGRWVLIIDNGIEICLFNDAVGFRQVFYTEKEFIEDTWCASQTGILAEELNLQRDEDAIKQLYDCYEKKDGQYWWPNDQTPFKEIKHLLPNHYLNLTSGLCARYWPNEDIPEMALEESVEKVAKLLKALIESAANRYELAYTITAGSDTRLLLAASRDISHKIYFFSMIYWHMTRSNFDVAIPSKLLKKLGLGHNVIECPAQMDDEFCEIYARNVPTARKVYGTIAQGLYDQYPGERICVKGNASEASKYSYSKLMRRDDGESVDGLILAKYYGLGKNSFVAHEFDKWLGTANSRKRNLKIMNLFHWEQRLGNWQGMSQTEWDIVMESFDPYNCRSLLITLLSSPEEFRKSPKYILFENLIKAMWLDVLREPINPEWKSTAAAIADIIKRTALHKVIPKSIRSKIKTRLRLH